LHELLLRRGESHQLEVISEPPAVTLAPHQFLVLEATSAS
jgi:hypothetical protein